MKLVNKRPDPVPLSSIAIGSAFKHGTDICYKTGSVDGSGDLGCVDLATGILSYLVDTTLVEIVEAELHYL